MAKIPLNGIIEEVGHIEYVGQNQIAKQNIVLFISGYVDEYGEKKGKDEHWQISIMGDAIDRFNLHTTHEGLKAKTEVWVKSSKYVTRDGKVGYMINANLANIEVLRGPARQAPAAAQAQAAGPVEQQTQQQPNNGEVPDDDLPF